MGGGIYLAGREPYVIALWNITFDGNWANQGGAIFSEANTIVLDISYVSMTGNVAKEAGGALQVYTARSVLIHGSLLEDNKAGSQSTTLAAGMLIVLLRSLS
jgi:predicted outer membrane repeat protein